MDDDTLAEYRMQCVEQAVRLATMPSGYMQPSDVLPTAKVFYDFVRGAEKPAD